VQIIYEHVIQGKTFASFTDSGMDIVTTANVQAMIDAWQQNDFSRSLPDPFPTP
jgi:hypothetical protein